MFYITLGCFRGGGVIVILSISVHRFKFAVQPEDYMNLHTWLLLHVIFLLSCLGLCYKDISLCTLL